MQTLSLFLAATLLLLPACASSTPEWQRLSVQPGESEQIFETVALVVSRRFPIERRDAATGVVVSRYIEERRAEGLFRWKATGVVRRERDAIVVAVSTIVEEFEEDGYASRGSVEEIDTALVAEIEERLRAANVGRGVRIVRLDPVETLEGGLDAGTAAGSPPESRPPRGARR